MSGGEDVAGYRREHQPEHHGDRTLEDVDQVVAVDAEGGLGRDQDQRALPESHRQQDLHPERAEDRVDGEPAERAEVVQPRGQAGARAAERSAC
jgi:hypothetical protein